MPAETLEELYVEQLRDLYSAETQILKALPKMVLAASHEDLQKAFEDHRGQTETHVARLEEIFGELGESPKGKICVGMEGVIKEGAELIEENPDPTLLDAGLIASAQHVEHYEMAGYGTVRTWAMQLGHTEHAELLQQTLDEEKEADELLSELAHSINMDAKVDDGTPRERRDISAGRSTSKRTQSKPGSRRGG